MAHSVTITRNYDNDEEAEITQTVEDSKALLNLCAKLILELTDKEITSFVIVAS